MKFCKNPIFRMSTIAGNYSLKVWIDSFRLRTLPLAIASILMGSFLAEWQGAFHWDVFGLTVLTTLFLQILSNLANDYGDSMHGADSQDRVGPGRAVQSGRISSMAMKKAIIVFTGLSLITGLILLYIAIGSVEIRFLIFLLFGILAIAAAISYTVGKHPYGYTGLGDLSVLIFFGITGVMGTFYLHSKYLSWDFLLPAISIGLFSVAVLNINNIRDIASDRSAGKLSIPVRIGRSNAVKYHWLLLLTGWLCALSFSILNYSTPLQFLYLIVLPMFLKNALSVGRTSESQLLDPFLKQMAIATLLFVIFFGAGLLFS